MKKATVVFAALLITAASFAQQQPSHPVQLNAKEVDSTKQRIVMLSQAIAQIPELTQGKAAELQRILQDLFATVIRNEEKPKEQPKTEKPKN